MSQHPAHRQHQQYCLYLLSIVACLLAAPLTTSAHFSFFFNSIAIAETPQGYKIEADKLLQQGIYEIESRQPEKSLQSLEQALRIYREIRHPSGEGNALANLGRAHFAFRSYAKAIEYSEQSLAIARSIKDQQLEVAVLKRLGLIYSLTGNHPKAISAVEQTLAIYRKSNNRVEEVQSLGDLGFVYLRAGNAAKAIEVQERGIRLAQELNDNSLIFEARGNLEQTYIVLRGDVLRNQMGQPPIATALEVEPSTTQRRAEADRLLQKGIQYLQNSRPNEAEQFLKNSVRRYRQIKDQLGEAQALIYLGKASLELGNSTQTLELMQQAVAIAKELNNPEIENSARQVLKSAQAIANAEQAQEEDERLSEQAFVQLFEGDFEAAYQSIEQLLAIYRTRKDRRQEMETLEGFAVALSMVSADRESAKMIQYYEQALIIARELKDQEAESRITRFLGLAGNFEDSFCRNEIKENEQKLATARKLQDQQSEMFALSSLAECHYTLRNYAKASMYHEQTIALARKLRGSSDESDMLQALSRERSALVGFGKIYASQGDYTKAIEYYQKSLKISFPITTFTNPDQKHDIGRLEPLRGIGDALQQQNQSELAIVFYKQAVNIVEAHRQFLREELRKSEQVSEAEPNNFYSAMSRFSQVSIVRDNAPMYRRLADLLFQQNRIIEGMQVLDLLKVQDLQDFLKNVRGSALTQEGVELLPEETAMVRTLQTASQPLQTSLQSASIQTQIQSLQKTAANQNLKLNTYEDLQTRRQKLGKNVALFYPLVLDDRLELVILMRDRPPVRKPVAISAKQLETEIQTFRQQLEGRSPQIQQSAQKLYQILFQPIETDLKAAGVDTIVYAPDSFMRYVPLAALHDGTQWLAERYPINYLTALALTPLDPDQNSQPRVLAAALTREQQITLLGKTHRFSALQFTQPEINNLSKILPNTTTLVDQTFNRANLTKNLPQSTILHLATHGMFVLGSPDQSIILLGDGSTISLREIEQQWKFPNLSLVVLSACETAIGGKLGNGIEILGFGYQMQRAGSRASLSSLWKVNDGGTQVLMNAFYGALKQGMTKAKAMQAAQKALITGDYTTVGGKRSDLMPSSAQAGQSVTEDKLTHPHYWAPFILVGNGL
jgi:CHAT domain-containing protein